MSLEENKARFRQFIEEVINNRNFDMIDELMDANFKDHNPPPGVAPGTAGMKEFIGMFVGGFPDLKSNIDMLLAEDDKVVGLLTTTGTHQGEFMGIPASGNKFSMTEFHIVRVVDHKAVEHWGLSDSLSMCSRSGRYPARRLRGATCNLAPLVPCDACSAEGESCPE